jgi:RsiW-degrading membrane proteinase PrsW (M82 family)
MSISMPSRKLLHRLSRDRDFLLRAALAIGLAGLVAAAVIDKVRDKARASDVRAEIVEPIDRIEALGWSLAGLGEEERAMPAARNAVERIHELILQWNLDDGVARLYGDFIRVCGALPEDLVGLRSLDSWHRMLMHCEQLDTGGQAHRLAAELALMAGWELEALRLLEDGFEKSAQPLLLARSVELALQWDERSWLTGLLRDTERFTQLDPRLRCDVAVRMRDYSELFVSVVIMDLQGLRPELFLLSLLSVAVWFAILMQLAAMWRRGIVMIAALCLGMIAALLTLYVVFIQENIRGFVPSGGLGSDLLYWIGGVGVREESIKALCFLFLLPYLLRQRSPLLAAVSAAVVGLGFALQENAIYFLEDGSSVTWGRFLTSTFMHASLTGIAGHALYQLARDVRRNWENALIDLIAVVVAHGMYNAFLGMVQLADYAVLSLVFIAYLAHRFLGLVGQLREAGRITVAPLGIFVLGCAVVLAVAVNFSLWDVPFGEGLFLFGIEVLGIAPVAFLFVRHFKEL